MDAMKKFNATMGKIIYEANSDEIGTEMIGLFDLSVKDFAFEIMKMSSILPEKAIVSDIFEIGMIINDKEKFDEFLKNHEEWKEWFEKQTE